MPGDVRRFTFPSEKGRTVDENTLLPQIFRKPFRSKAGALAKIFEVEGEKGLRARRSPGVGRLR